MKNALSTSQYKIFEWIVYPIVQYNRKAAAPHKMLLGGIPMSNKQPPPPRARSLFSKQEANLVSASETKCLDDGGTVGLGGDALLLVLVQADLPGRSRHLHGGSLRH